MELLVFEHCLFKPCRQLQAFLTVKFAESNLEKVIVGHKQNPSWCFAVNIMRENPAFAATFTHWLALRPTGLKIAGFS
jgi:hypothetical protein